jgi:iron(III) transport system substrate-binding protein
MKKNRIFSVALLVLFVLSSVVAGGTKEVDLVVYGSTEEAHIKVTVDAFKEKTGYNVVYQRLSAGEVQTKISEEVKAGGKPSGDVFFGGTNDIYNEMAAEGLLMPYKRDDLQKRFVSSSFYDADGYWYGIYKNVLGIFYSDTELKLRKVAPPTGWVDLLDSRFAGLVTACNPNTAGTGKQMVNVIAQLCYTESFRESVSKKLGMRLNTQEDCFKAYFAALDKNVKEYTKSGGKPANYLASGEVVIGISYMQNVVEQFVAYNIDDARVVQIEESTGYEICSVGILANCAHPDVAKEFIEYCTTTDFVSYFKAGGCYATPCIKDENGKPYEVPEAAALGVTSIPLFNYDTIDPVLNTKKYVGWFTEAIGSGSQQKLKTS